VVSRQVSIHLKARRAKQILLWPMGTGDYTTVFFKYNFAFFFLLRSLGEAVSVLSRGALHLLRSSSEIRIEALSRGLRDHLSAFILVVKLN